MSFSLVLGALALLKTRILPGNLQPAIIRIYGVKAENRPRKTKASSSWIPLFTHRSFKSPIDRIYVSRIGTGSDWKFLARLGVGIRPPHKAITGRRARIRWWHRLISLTLLLSIVVIVGLAIASLTAILIIAGGFLLEQAIG